MKHAIAFLGLALLAAGCGDSGKPSAEAAAAQAANKPAIDETKACISSYMAQCGWKDVEFAQFSENAELPSQVKVVGDAWAFTFTANYTNVVGERQTSENWVAVLAKENGKPYVKSCFDSSKKLVGGHIGLETTETAVLTPAPPAEEYPAIVAPKP
jgi:hypothetical protein